MIKSLSPHDVVQPSDTSTLSKKPKEILALVNPIISCQISYITRKEFQTMLNMGTVVAHGSETKWGMETSRCSLSGRIASERYPLLYIIDISQALATQSFKSLMHSPPSFYCICRTLQKSSPYHHCDCNLFLAKVKGGPKFS